MNRQMTEAEHEQLVAVGDSFWTELGRLAARHIAMLPADIEDHVICHLQEKCSIYGTDYYKHLAACREQPDEWMEELLA